MMASPEKLQNRDHVETDCNCLVVGASRGIGLALAAKLLEDRASCRVIATHRSAAPGEGLSDLQKKHPGRLVTVPLDVTDPDSLDQFAGKIAQLEGGLSLFIHVAGILHEGDISPEKSLEQCNPDALMSYFAVNSVGPLMVARALLPLQPRSGTFVFAFVSAMVGSIGDNRRGGWYGYRASKAALNQFVRTLAIEVQRRHPGAAVVALHPGTTDTDLSRPFQRNIKPGKLYSPMQTASRLLGVLEQLDENNTGRFFNWDGSEIPW